MKLSKGLSRRISREFSGIQGNICDNGSMFKILKAFFRADPKALFSLFFVGVFAVTAIITLRELVENVEQTVAREARPYL